MNTPYTTPPEQSSLQAEIFLRRLMLRDVAAIAERRDAIEIERRAKQAATRKAKPVSAPSARNPRSEDDGD
jgi:hypothetical protein